MLSARLAGAPAEDPGTRRFQRGAAGSPLPVPSKSGGMQSGGKSWGGCKVSISGFFEKMGAPLKNKRWSWGAIRPSDGAVFLRAWQDQTHMENGELLIRVTDREAYADKPDDAGWKERLEHVECVRSDSPCYIVMCRVKDPTAFPREIDRCNTKEVFVGDRIVERDGDFWVAVKRRVPLEEVLIK